MILINLNDEVKVKLTPFGVQVYENSWIKLGQQAPTLFLDDDGYLSIQLWELAQIFGPTCWMGNPHQAFVDNIVLISDPKDPISKGQL